MKRCPICGGEKFHTTAHVVQSWLVDGLGEYLECLDDCLAVAHYPDDEDLWSCAVCNYQAGGDEFNTEEEKDNE